MIRLIKENRSLWIGMLCALLAVFFACGTPLLSAYKGVRFGGYLVVMALSLFGLLAAVPLFISELKRMRFRPADGFFLIVLLGLMACLLGRMPAQFQVLSDELTLQNTALSMYSEREVFSANQGIWVDGEYEVTSGHLNKRPFLYPFLVSLLHSIFGYDLMHGFILNFALSLFALAVGFVLFRLWFQNPLPVFLALVMLACSPLLLAHARAAGFELLHFCFLGIYGVALTLYSRRYDARSEAFLVATTLLIAYIRYESCVLVFITGGMILYGCRRERRWFQSQLTVLAPFFLIPLVWLFRCTMARKGSWPVAEAEGIQVFGLQYVWGNLKDALVYFYHPSWVQANDFFLSLVGGFGVLLLMIAWWRSTAKVSSSDGDELTTAAIQQIAVWSVGFFLLFMVYSGYFWSSFLDPAARRMSLPFLWMYALGLAYVLHWLVVRWRLAVVWPILLVIVGLTISTFPTSMQMDVHREANQLAKLQTWKLHWAEGAKIDPESSWFIDDDPNLWTARRSTVFSSRLANERLSELELHWRAQTFEALYSVQFWVLGKSGRWRQLNGQLPEAFELSEVPEVEYALDSHYYCRIYRVVNLTVENSKYDAFWDGELPSDAERPNQEAFELYLWQNLPI